MRTVWSFGIPEGAEGKDPVASMGKLLSSPLKLNILEGLLSISLGSWWRGRHVGACQEGPVGHVFQKTVTGWE